MTSTGDNGNVRFICQTVPHGKGDKMDLEDEANHALISHAVNMLPKLVGALEKALEDVEFNSNDFDLINHLGAVLAEANNPKEAK